MRDRPCCQRVPGSSALSFRGSGARQRRRQILSRTDRWNAISYVHPDFPLPFSRVDYMHGTVSHN